MEIKELNRFSQTTVRTIIEFTFDCGCKIDVEIPHYMPKDEAEIQLGIHNRFITESEAHKCSE
jgi:hypothetical protein